MNHLNRFIFDLWDFFFSFIHVSSTFFKPSDLTMFPGIIFPWKSRQIRVELVRRICLRINILNDTRVNCLLRILTVNYSQKKKKNPFALLVLDKCLLYETIWFDHVIIIVTVNHEFRALERFRSDIYIYPTNGRGTQNQKLKITLKKIKKK